MQPIANHDIKDLVEYERIRDEIRPRIIQTKRARRVSVGDNLTFLFENRDTVWLQIQEMIRTERIVEAHKIQDELDAYNARPGAGAPAGQPLPGARQGRRVARDRRAPARGALRDGTRKEEKMAAVHYLHFSLDPVHRAALADQSQRVRIVVEQPACGGERAIGPETRRQLIADLAD